MRPDRAPTSTLEFLINSGISSARLPTFEPKVSTKGPSRGQAVVFVGLIALGVALLVACAILLR